MTEKHYNAIINKKSEAGDVVELKKQKDRIYLFDNMKFFLILAVVVGHFADAVSKKPGVYKSIFVFIYAFHMPLFLFCSGLFHKNKDVFIRAFRYVSVGFATKIIFTLTSLVLGTKVSFTLLGDSGIPWYMFVLAIYVVITYALRNVDKKYLLVFSILLALFVGYDSTIGDYLYLSRVIVFYPFYLCGQLVSKEDILKLNSNKLLKAVSVVIIAAWLIFCFTQRDIATGLRPLFTGRNSFATSEVFARWGFLFRAACYVITTLVSLAIICLMPNIRLPLITSFGSRTLQVYLWHWPVVRVLQEVGVTALLMTNASGKIGWLLIGVALTFILSLKLFSFPTKQIFTYCRKENKA